MATFPLSVVTPERVLLEEEMQAVFLRTELGEAAFLAGHAPLVASVVPGVVRLQREDGTEERVAVHGGFVQVDGAKVVLLAPVAELASEVDVDRARRALEAAMIAVGGSASASTGGSTGGSAGGSAAGSSAGSSPTGEPTWDEAGSAALRRAQVRLDAAQSQS